jgi:uncharacterized protein YndB with AHSA1/START domain
MNASDPVEPDSVIVDCELDEPPDVVWRALTTPALTAVWLAEGDIKAEVGHQFELQLEAGPVECEVLEADPRRRLSVSWRERDEAGELVESEVSFVLTPTISGGTRLRLIHDGFVRSGIVVVAIGRIAKAVRESRAASAWSFAWAA